MTGRGDEDELPPSILGTKAYWQKTYRRENANFDHHGDEGEIWFGEESMDKIFSWLGKNEQLIPKSAYIADLGCGNGRFCIELACEGYENVMGVDYCQGAIDLSRKIASQHGVNNVVFEECDILGDVQDIVKNLKREKFDVCLDKGTYDAISLCPDEAKAKRQTYVQNVASLLRKDGFFIVTSCNWTETELTGQLSNRFQLHYAIPTKQFQFGGKVGNMFTSMILRKK